MRLLEASKSMELPFSPLEVPLAVVSKPLRSKVPSRSPTKSETSKKPAPTLSLAFKLNLFLGIALTIKLIAIEIEPDKTNLELNKDSVLGTYFKVN